MFDYVQRVQLALGDVARRSAFKAVAGLLFAIGAGFLLAALWSWLATGLGWGSMLASLAIGGGLIVTGLLIIAVSARRKHRMPTTDDLRREVEARVGLAADAASARAQAEALRMVGMVENKAHSLFDRATFRANKFASDAERQAQDLAHKAGFTPENVHAARETADRAQKTVRRAAASNPGSMAKLLGAFAIGVALAARLRERGHRDDDPDRMA